MKYPLCQIAMGKLSKQYKFIIYSREENIKDTNF